MESYFYARYPSLSDNAVLTIKKQRNSGLFLVPACSRTPIYATLMPKCANTRNALFYWQNSHNISILHHVIALC